MLEAVIPYLTMPEKTLVDLPVIGQLKLQVFGPLVAIGVLIAMQRVLTYAKQKDMDEFMVRDLMFWVLVFGFTISHWVSVIFYFPQDVIKNPWLLLMIWNGLSSVGGFFGALVGVWWFARKHNQPRLPLIDALVFGFVTGFTFGRLGCSLVHDHPGTFVENLPSWLSWLEVMAVGPWPGTGGRFRLDLGLLEFLYDVGIVIFVYLLYGWKKDRRPGHLTGLVCMLYAPYRFLLDFARGPQDPRYLGLTTAHYATLALFLIGVYLVFIRKEKPEDRQWAKDSVRIAAEKKAAEDKAAADAQPGTTAST
ncbi:MAG: prolipoprotein diacylglyceryl transferase [Nannocystaceae bacterium]